MEDACPEGGWTRPLRLPLALSLLVHAVVVAGYFLFMAGRPSPVPAWLQRFDPVSQPPQLPLTLVVVAAGVEDEMPPGPEPVPPANEPARPEPRKELVPPPAPPLPPPAEPAPQPLPSTPTLEAPAALPAPLIPVPEPVIVASSSIPLPAAVPSGGSSSAWPNEEASHGVSASVSAPARAVQSASTGGSPAGKDGTGPTGNFSAARLRQPPHLQRFYPYAARAQAITGVTHLVLELDAAGRVQAARVTAGQPAGVFDQAALRAARALRFEPARRNGQPVPTQFDLAIEWRMEP